MSLARTGVSERKIGPRVSAVIFDDNESRAEALARLLTGHSSRWSILCWSAGGELQQWDPQTGLSGTAGAESSLEASILFEHVNNYEFSRPEGAVRPPRVVSFSGGSAGVAQPPNDWVCAIPFGLNDTLQGITQSHLDAILAWASGETLRPTIQIAPKSDGLPAFVILAQAYLIAHATPAVRTDPAVDRALALMQWTEETRTALNNAGLAPADDWRANSEKREFWSCLADSGADFKRVVMDELDVTIHSQLATEVDKIATAAFGRAGVRDPATVARAYLAACNALEAESR